MRAVVVSGSGELGTETVPDPSPAPGQLVLRVSRCGICGSDLHVHQLGLLEAGAVMGHEFCGEVMESAEGFRAGEHVTALPTLSCGHCERCRRGMGMYCQRRRVIGLGEAPGAFAELVAVAVHEIVRLPDGVDDDHGALIEPLAVGLHAVKTAGIRRGERCVVLGAGPIGLAALIWARHFHAGEIIVSERSAGRRAVAESLGASRVIDPEAEDLAEAIEASAPGGADVVFEAVGAPGLIAQAVELAGFRSRVVVVGVCIGPDELRPALAVMKEARLSFVLAYEKDDFTYAADMIQREQIAPAPMISRRIGLDGVAAAFEDLARPDADTKVLVAPGAAT